MATFIWYIILAVAVIVGWFVYAYNRLVTLKIRSSEALSDIDVQTKRRYDLIPNLVEAVKGYMQHERNVLENVTKARTEAMATTGTSLEREGKENFLSNTLKTLFAVAENYPDLKANANFLDLQRELADTENKIQSARRFYNTTVMDLNTKIDTFPSNFLAGAFGFTAREFFDLEEEAAKQPVRVQF